MTDDEAIILPARPYPPHPPAWRIEAALVVLRTLPDIHSPAWEPSRGIITWRTTGRVDRWVQVDVHWGKRYTEADGWYVMGWVKQGYGTAPIGRNWRETMRALNRGIN